MAKSSPTPWRVSHGYIILDADGVSIAHAVRCPDAALIVEAVNATGAWREERRRLKLAAASAEAAFLNADARLTLLERCYCEVYADRDRLRDLVRRLTPVECERLQGFPDGWTRIPYRGKPAYKCPDSPRYKALGNSWATNCAEWILRRIVAAVRLGLIPEDETP